MTQTSKHLRFCSIWKIRIKTYGQSCVYQPFDFENVKNTKKPTTYFSNTFFLIGCFQSHTRSLSKTVLRRQRVWLNHTFKIAPQKRAATFEFHITLPTSFGGHFAANLRGYILENAHWVHVSSDKVIATCTMHGILHADWTDVEKLQPKWRERCISFFFVSLGLF